MKSKNKRAKIIVNKFGGGIMVAKFIKSTAQVIKKQKKANFQPIVVVSALKGITDELVEIFNLVGNSARKKTRSNRSNQQAIQKKINTAINKIEEKHQNIIKTLSFQTANLKKLNQNIEQIFNKLKNDLVTINRFGVLEVFYDRILSYGEKLAALIFVFYLRELGFKAKRYKTDQIPIETDDHHTDANIDYEKSKVNLRKKLKNKQEIPVLTGFIGQNQQGSTTTLGRGGTDTTACFVAAAMNAKKIILWKDVEGVMSADPRMVKQVKNVPYLSYKEAEESGKVIHDKAIQYIKKSQIAFEVRSIVKKQQKTVIAAQTKSQGAKIISYKQNLTLIIITDEGVSEYGFLYRISKLFNDLEVNMVLIRNTRDSLHIVVEKNNGNVEQALKRLKREKYNFQANEIAMVSVIGTLSWQMASQLNQILEQHCQKPIIGAFPYQDAVRLEAVVKDRELKKVVRAMHEKFIKV
ncbi:MAG: aspartate kinase [Candidatus Moranbacteria bacterium]|nr:aspartate kinase [Candidatus Moranbacteria bacterium]